MPSRSLRCCPTFPRQLKSSRVLSPAYARSTAILSTCAAELGPLEFVDANAGVRKRHTKDSRLLRAAESRLAVPLRQELRFTERRCDGW